MTEYYDLTGFEHERLKGILLAVALTALWLLLSATTAGWLM